MKYGFDEVPGGYVSNASDMYEWGRPALSVLEIPPDDYLAYIAATDDPPVPYIAGSSACAWELRHAASLEVIKLEVWSGRPRKSSENKGYVAGVLGVLERLPAGSKATLICRSDWIVNALNGDLWLWIDEGRLKGKRQVAYADIWQRIAHQIVRISADRSAISGAHPGTDHEAQRIIEQLLAKARAACQRM